jgi:Type IV secretion system pilin
MTFAQLVYNVIVPIIDRGVIPFLYAIAFLFFLFGVARFFFSDSEENRKKGKDFALWGIVGFFALFSVWGLVRLLLTVIQ